MEIAVGLYFFIGAMVAVGAILEGRSIGDAAVGFFLWPLVLTVCR